MKTSKQNRLEVKGWRIGSAADFLKLTDEERTLLELKINMGKQLRSLRLRNEWTQVQFARIVKSSQSRVAKMESGDPSVSLDLLFKSLLATGATMEDLAQAINSEAQFEIA